MSRILSAVSCVCVLMGCVASDRDDASSGPQFPGAGDDGADDPLGPGADLYCFYGEGSDNPAATIEHVTEVFAGADAVHVRLTLDPDFVDNTYGAMAMGWADSKKGAHTFQDLYKSDHAELLLADGNGDTAFDLKIDYLSEDPSAVSGWGSLGVTGGDGEVVLGDPDAVVQATSSLHRNLNQRGYDQYSIDSPVTDAAYTPDPNAPGWDYRVVYEVWVTKAAFGAAGFGQPFIEFVHASPSKGADNTIVVDPAPCPPDWGCNDPDGCDHEPNDCNDPDGCDNGPGDPMCQDDADCATGEFCGEGHCVPYIR